VIERLRTYPHDEKDLRTPTERVRDVTPAVRKFAAELVAWMREYDGAGLAANQVEQSGETIPTPSIVVMAREEESLVLINPEILSTEGSEALDEGCLSFGTVVWKLAAPTLVRVRFTTVEGLVREEVFRGFLARCAVHEVDHLGGKLMIDRMARWERRVFLKKVLAAQAGHR
jgi:peptide deformylase